MYFPYILSLNVDEKDHLVSIVFFFLYVLSYLYVKVSSRAETFQDVSLPIPGKEIVVELMGRNSRVSIHMQMLLRGNIILA